MRVPALFVLCLLNSLVVRALPFGGWSTSVPFWPHYPTRLVQVLDGKWEFGYYGAGLDPLNVDPTIATPNSTVVPSAFDVAPPGVLGRRGTAVYRTRVDIAAGHAGMLYLAACSFYCRAFVDDTFVGEHRAGGYQPFWLNIPPANYTTRTILVVANNQYNSTLAPTHTGGDFWEYGGITRNVLVHTLPKLPVYIRQVETFTLNLDGDLKIRIVLADAPASGPRAVATLDCVQVQLVWDGVPGITANIPVKNTTAVISSVKVPNFQLWSLEAPNLHILTVNLMALECAGAAIDASSALDSVSVRFGLRTITVDPTSGRLLLNGKPVKLHGFNRHTMWPDTGSALTYQQVVQDVKVLLDVNANYVRGAHYPQDQRFLDLCDEHGIVVWEETLGPGTTVADLTNPYFMKYQIEAVNEMIDASVNHPCVILHAFYNEGPSDNPAACPGYNESAEAIRNRIGSPPTRLVTWASDKKTSDVCLPIADVISFNSYPAWYDHPGILNETKIFWKSQVEWVEKHFPNKPFTISETGAGGVYEWTNKTDPRWSQQYQLEVVERDVEFALGSDRLSGIAVWQFNDIKANQQDTALCGQCVYYPHPPSLSVPWNCSFVNVSCGRPGGENHKGAVDFWRRPKAVYARVKQLYANGRW